MGVQNSSTVSTRSAVFRGFPMGLFENDAVILTNAGRTTPLLTNTVMARVVATGKFVPWTSITATDGTAIPCGVYVGPEITAAKIVAGDVNDCQILVGFAEVEEGKLVFENSRTLADVIASSDATNVYNKLRARDYLYFRGIVPRTVTTAGTVEN